MERYKNGITGKKTNTPEPEFKFEAPIFKKKSFNADNFYFYAD